MTTNHASDGIELRSRPRRPARHGVLELDSSQYWILTGILGGLLGALCFVLAAA